MYASANTSMHNTASSYVLCIGIGYILLYYIYDDTMTRCTYTLYVHIIYRYAAGSLDNIINTEYVFVPIITLNIHLECPNMTGQLTNSNI